MISAHKLTLVKAFLYPSQKRVFRIILSPDSFCHQIRSSARFHPYRRDSFYRQNMEVQGYRNAMAKNYRRTVLPPCRLNGYPNWIQALQLCRSDLKWKHVSLTLVFFLLSLSLYVGCSYRRIRFDLYTRPYRCSYSNISTPLKSDSLLFRLKYMIFHYEREHFFNDYQL